MVVVDIYDTSRYRVVCCPEKTFLSIFFFIDGVVYIVAFSPDTYGVQTSYVCLKRLWNSALCPHLPPNEHGYTNVFVAANKKGISPPPPARKILIDSVTKRSANSEIQPREHDTQKKNTQRERERRKQKQHLKNIPGIIK